MRSLIPRRYFVLMLNTATFVTFIAYRTTFSMVMTHVSRVNTTTEADSMFPNCTTTGTNRDFAVPWTVEDISLLHTVFFAGGVITQIPLGIVTTLVSPRKVCAVILFLTSLFNMFLSLGIQSNYYGLMALRFIQGLLEGAMVPAMNGVASRWITEKERTRFVAIYSTGAYFSPAFAMVITGATACYVRFDTALYLNGAVGFVCSAMYTFAIYDSPHADPSITEEELHLFKASATGVLSKSSYKLSDVPWKAILSSGPVFAVFVGSFARNFVFALMITEIPQYYKDVFGVNTATIGVLTAIPHVLMGTVGILSGFCYDSLIINGRLSRTAARKMAQTIGFGIEAVAVFGLSFVGNTQWVPALFLLCVGVGISGMVVSGYQCNQIELAPPFSSLISALSRLGTIGAVISTAMTAGIVGSNHALSDWQTVFLITGIIHMCCVILYVIFASGETQEWAKK